MTDKERNQLHREEFVLEFVYPILFLGMVLYILCHPSLWVSILGGH